MAHVHTFAPFIALEGIDGSGTTTQLALLGQRLRRLGHQVTQTAEPSQGVVGRSCREALSAAEPLPDAVLALMFAADRLHHQQHCIDVARAAGHVVLCDRYLLSSLAYQGLSLPEPWLWAINSRARRPDISILLHVPWHMAQQRVAARGATAEQFDGAALQARISARYLALAQQPNAETGPVICVDGTGSQEAVAARLGAVVDGILASPPTSTVGQAFYPPSDIR